MTQKILLTLEIDDSALDAAQAKADKLVATLKEAEALTCALENAVAIDHDNFAERLAAVKALANEKPPEGGLPIEFRSLIASAVTVPVSP